MTRPVAAEALYRLAAGVSEANTPAAVGRLLERIAERDDRDELRDALVMIGAAAVILHPVGSLD